MYTITHLCYTHDNNKRYSEHSVETAKEASQKLIRLSHDAPISYIRFGKQEPFRVKKRKYKVQIEWYEFEKWWLDYSIEELAEMIRKALPDGGTIDSWHNPWAGMP